MTVKNPVALLNYLLQQKTEAEWLELKHNNCEPQRIGQTVSACANAAILMERDRGYIVWGIKDGTKEKVGTTVRLKMLKKGGENFENWLSHKLDPTLMVEAVDFEENGKQFSILAFEPSYTRPVKFEGVEYVRIGENVKPLKDHEERERSIWFATSKRKFESGIALSHQTAEAVLAKLNVATFYERSGQATPGNQEEILRKFEKLGAITPDMEGGYDITNLGALLFADDITEFPSIASKSIRVVHYEGRDKGRSQDEIHGKKGYAVGFPGLLNYVEKKLPKGEKYEGGVRKASTKYSQIAVREIIANALIHQDFTITGSAPIVEIYDDRMEVSNPGDSLIERNRLIDERRSRNVKLAEAMQEMGLCEQRGGGIDKAIKEIERLSLPAPHFWSSDKSMRVVLWGPKTFKELSKEDRVWACFCHCVVRFLRHDRMTNTSLRERFALHQEDYQAISTLIAQTKRAGLIKPEDPKQGKRYGKYVPYWA